MHTLGGAHEGTKNIKIRKDKLHLLYLKCLNIFFIVGFLATNCCTIVLYFCTVVIDILYFFSL